MFRIVSAVAFGLLVVGLGVHLRLFPCNLKVSLFKLRSKAGTINRISALICLGLLASFLGLFVTGFGPLLLGGKLHGYLLMFHATCAPVFIGCAGLLVLMYAGKHAFDLNDADAFKSGCSIKKSQNTQCWLTDTGLGAKVCFWVLAVLAVPLAMTMVLSMLSLFGTNVQECLFELHRWIALIFALIMFFELYMLLRMNN